MEPKKRYSWAQGPDGKYSIFQVEIFRSYEDVDGGRGKVDDDDAAQILKTFEQEKNSGHYPPVHVWHHNPEDPTENRPRVGYFDNLQYRDGIFYADMVHISPENFQKFQDGEFPYRSSEYIPVPRPKIKSVALLQSQSPYFKFPMMFLADDPSGPVPVDMSYSERSAVIMFAEKNESEVKNMPIPENPEGLPEDEVLGDDVPGDDVPGDDDDEVEIEDPFMALNEKLDQIMVLLGQQQQMCEKRGDGPKMPQGGQMAQSPQAQNPMPVAMQEMVAGITKNFQSTLGRLEAKISTLEKDRGAEAWRKRVKAVCDTAPMRFQDEFDALMSFSDDTGKANYLKILQNKAASFYHEHPATAFAKTIDPEDKLFQEFPQKDRKNAILAANIYAQTVIKFQNEPEALRQFQEFYPTQKDFVTNMVERIEYEPNILQTITEN